MLSYIYLAMILRIIFVYPQKVNIPVTSANHVIWLHNILLTNIVLKILCFIIYLHFKFWETPSHISLQILKTRLISTLISTVDARECLTETLGLDYVGSISTTITGRTCQHWKKQSPHTHRLYNVSDGHNYCRNPDREAKPWCYTTDKDKRWEYCDIPLCSK